MAPHWVSEWEIGRHKISFFPSPCQVIYRRRMKGKGGRGDRTYCAPTENCLNRHKKCSGAFILFSPLGRRGRYHLAAVQMANHNSGTMPQPCACNIKENPPNISNQSTVGYSTNHQILGEESSPSSAS